MGGSEGAAGASAEACDADALVQAVENGEAEGTLSGMTDDPVATAASNNPVLTTLTTAVGEAGLVDTLNSAEALTVFAPTDCTFSQLDRRRRGRHGRPHRPAGPGPRVSTSSPASSCRRLTGQRQSLETFTGASLSVSPDGDDRPQRRPGRHRGAGHPDGQRHRPPHRPGHGAGGAAHDLHPSRLTCLCRRPVPSGSGPGVPRTRRPAPDVTGGASVAPVPGPEVGRRP